MIPYKLYKNHGFQSEIVTWENGDYPDLSSKTDGLKLVFAKKSPFGRIYDGMHYLKYESSSIDILNIYHLNATSFFYERVFRKYNPMGKIYLKLDMNEKGFKDVFRFGLKGMIKRAVIKQADIASVENTRMHTALSARFKDKVIFIPNGFYEEPSGSGQDEKDLPEAATDKDGLQADTVPEKSDMILTVGNLGTPEKGTDILLDAFAESAGKHDYSLCLAGPVTPSFGPKVAEFYKEHQELKDRITFTGPISDRKQLSDLYRKARIFAFPSRSESFGFALLEAASNGCYIIASDACSAAGDITNNGKFGTIVKASDVSSLAEAFIFFNEAPPDSNQLRAEEIRYIKKYYNWDDIISKLHSELVKLFKRA
ncbi:MAG: glycosyltransferase family 4 protein [Lachnospiraceae bacterium]|nr:glycosyltransferase family 4 protein [Lachnospiraceae bacterium]